MNIVEKAIQSLNLNYEIQYSVVDLMDESFVALQKEFYEFLNNRRNSKMISPLESEDIEKRVYPNKLLDSAKSVIVLLFPYLTECHKNGNMSLYCMGEDYHIHVSRNLKKIVEYIKKYEENSNFYIQTDNGELNEKFFAYNSGIGILGLNSLIMSPIYGSYVNIGLIVTDFKISKNTSSPKKCDECMKCVKYCPGSAIRADFTIDSEKCASYITQKKGELSDEEKSVLRKTGKVFGCDICQLVCHYNENAKKIPCNYDIINNLYNEDLQISNKEFKAKFGDRAFSFRGKNVLIRNIEVIQSGV